MTASDGLCPDQDMMQIVGLADEPEAALAALEEALTGYPLDPRLHFLKGSLLIGLKRHVGAHAALSRAVELAPGYDLARFQLGLFELTSGEPDAARQTWRGLAGLPDDSPLRLFVQGLEALIEDRFADCVTALEAGMALNHENPPLNHDMGLVVAQCRQILSGNDEPEDPDAALSLTSLLLGGAGSGGRH